MIWYLFELLFGKKHHRHRHHGRRHPVRLTLRNVRSDQTITVRFRTEGHN